MKKCLFALLSAMLLTVSSVPASAASAAKPAPLFEGSFLQGWLCRDWTQPRWESELAAMKQLGFRSVILQSTADLTYEKDENSGENRLVSSSALFPTELVSGSEEASALALALDAAAQTGMQVYIGTLSDSRWWNYGWGVPGADFSAWCAENARQNAALIREIESLFGERYGSQIAGFYYNNEIWNMDAACSGSDGGAYAAVIGENLRTVLNAVTEFYPDKPLLISPFYNETLSTSAEYAAFLSAVADSAGLRPIDIIAPQDGGGREYTPELIGEWTDAAQAALAGKVRFWVNNETFGLNSAAKPMETLRADYLATTAAEKHLLFSWNHYYHGQYDAEFEKLLHQMTGDVNADGACTLSDAVYLLRWLMHDRIHLQNWNAADLDGSGALNAADFSMLKSLLLYDDTEVTG